MVYLRLGTRQSLCCPSYSHHLTTTPVLPIRQHKPNAQLSPLAAGRRAVALGRNSAQKGSATPAIAAGQLPTSLSLTTQARLWRHCHVGRFRAGLNAQACGKNAVAPPLRSNSGVAGRCPHDSTDLWAGLYRLGPLANRGSPGLLWPRWGETLQQGLRAERPDPTPSVWLPLRHGMP